MSSACRASIGAIPPVWWRPRRGPSSTVHLSQRNSFRLVAVSLESRPRPGPLALSAPSGERRIFDDGGFCTIRSILPACRRRVVALLVQFPPFGGCEVAVRGGMAPKPQTTSAKNANNGVSWARWSTFWAKLSPTWCVVRT